jgi:hypothetical protein
MVNDPTPEPPTDATATDEEPDVEGFVLDGLDGLGGLVTGPGLEPGSAASTGNLAKKRQIRDAQKALDQYK